MLQCQQGVLAAVRGSADGAGPGPARGGGPRPVPRPVPRPRARAPCSRPSGRGPGLGPASLGRVPGPARSGLVPGRALAPVRSRVPVPVRSRARPVSRAVSGPVSGAVSAPGAVRWLVVSRNRPVSWSRTAQSMCPVTIGVSAASHAAAAASGPVRYTDPGSPPRRRGRCSSPPPAPRRRAGPAARPGRRARSRTGWLLASPGSIPAVDQPLAGFLQRIVLPLEQGAGIFRAAPGPQRVQHHGHRGGGRAGQVPVSRPAPPIVVSSHTARSSNRSRPVSGVVRDRSIICSAKAPRSASPAPPQGGGEQDRVGVAAAVFRQLIGPLTQGPGPGDRQLPGRQRVGDGGMGGQPPGPPHRPAGGAAG